MQLTELVTEKDQYPYYRKTILRGFANACHLKKGTHAPPASIKKEPVPRTASCTTFD
jgi:hypothetical protein